MKHWLLAFSVAFGALALILQGANAASRHPGVTAASIGVGAASTASFFALQGWSLKGHHRSGALGSTGAAVVTTAGCLALSPIVGTALTQRELSYREAYGLFADCMIPFIGAWLVDKAFDAHPEWEPDRVVARPARAVMRSERPVRRRASRHRQ
jgi:hypothetical protein